MNPIRLVTLGLRRYSQAPTLEQSVKDLQGQIEKLQGQVNQMDTVVGSYGKLTQLNTGVVAGFIGVSIGSFLASR